MDDPFATIGAVIAASLEGTDWTSAWLSAAIIDRGVLQSMQAYSDGRDATEREFDLIDPTGVMRAVEFLHASMVAQGFPRWTGIVFRLSPSGEFKVEYSYGPPPPL